ncbi:GNAT family N-acetyltransferase [Streptomyces sp. NBC_00237]|uniref:GNAT family N-acetyltransferase n=1 Tax=Streptomyces sp. NBC_00237 TaxID=2975687 RepID=UPI00225BBAE5|nr:GNAT family N-acetyltransferase [Streptomyces sp. NBC_00237]MCX5202010.1 GNAT family N-acetyltransferase [Streptomyces sp. NBC_00237]
MRISLREVRDSDLPVFFQQTNDAAAAAMAAFTAEDPADREHFAAHWRRNLSDPRVVALTVVGHAEDGEEVVVGNAAVFGPPEEREITYWIGREYWGRGLATQALRALLERVPDRPLYGRAAADNSGSIRVMEKCGFVLSHREKGYANARGARIEEAVFTLSS